MSGPLDFEDDESGGGARRAPAEAEAPRGADPEPPAPAPAPAPARGGGSRYLWVVGAGAVVLIVVLLVATVQHGTGRGARGVPDGSVMPPFAVPVATSSLDGDANLATKAGEGLAGREPACTVRRPDVVNGCALRDAGPVVLTFFTIKSKDCVAQLDAMQRVQAQVPGVRFAAVAVRGSRGDLRAIVRRHGWTFPVGYDHDGGLSNAYHVQVCPQITFAARGGRVVDTTFGTLRDDVLARKARALGS